VDNRGAIDNDIRQPPPARLSKCRKFTFEASRALHDVHRLDLGDKKLCMLSAGLFAIAAAAFATADAGSGESRNAV
jgi:hypothetical protein